MSGTWIRTHLRVAVARWTPGRAGRRRMHPRPERRTEPQPPTASGTRGRRMRMQVATQSPANGHLGWDASGGHRRQKERSGRAERLDDHVDVTGHGFDSARASARWLSRQIRRRTRHATDSSWFSAIGSDCCQLRHSVHAHQACYRAASGGGDGLHRSGRVPGARPALAPERGQRTGRRMAASGAARRPGPRR